MLVTATRCYRGVMSAKPPDKNLRWDRVLLLLVVLAAVGGAVYMFALK